MKIISMLIVLVTLIMSLSYFPGVSIGAISTLEVRIDRGSDDAEEASGNVDLTSSALELVWDGSDQIVGLRFNGVDIRKGALITNAYIQFKVVETPATETYLNIQGEATDNSQTFTSSYESVTSRTSTSALVVWEPPVWATAGEADIDQRTPDISSIIQEIVNRDGWASGNSMVIGIWGTGERVAASYNGDPSGAPLLHVEYINNEVETICDDTVDNDEDGLVDCEDPDCDALTSYFDTGADGFVYTDDTFYSTGNPVYASGNYASGDGYSGGGLHVALGGINGADITNGMSGGWSKDFTLLDDSIVSITFRYRLVMTSSYEPDECSRVLVAIDGTSVPGPDSYVEEACGDGQGDSGWKEVTIDVDLSAGPHTLTVGGWNSKKTQYFERTDIYFDDIAIWNICTESILCGNGNLDDSEECDNGPDNGATVCGCQSDCTYTLLNTSCADGAFCNGNETCDGAGICRPGTPVDCSDGVGCTDDSCDENADVCVSTSNDANCSDNGQFCDGTEFCDPINDCQAGTPPVIDDGVGCTDDSCDEANDVVVNTPNDGNCDNGQFCDGSETCDAVNDCQAGTPPCNPATENCNEGADTCEPIGCTSDAECDNGQYCDGAETCDVSAGQCQAGTLPCNPATESCDETQDICIVLQCPCFDAGQIVGVFENSCADGSGGPDGGICNVSMRERLFAAGSEKESEAYLVLNVMSGPLTGYQYVAGVERNTTQGCYIRINGEYVIPQTSTDISDSEYELCYRILKEIQFFPKCE